MYDYTETIEKDENNNFCKVIAFRNVMNVLQYKKYKVFISFDAACILNIELKYEKVHVIINNIEIFDEVTSKNMNVLEFKNQLFDIYKAFTNFMEGIKGLICDLNFLNKILE